MMEPVVENVGLQNKKTRKALEQCGFMMGGRE